MEQICARAERMDCPVQRLVVISMETSVRNVEKVDMAIGCDSEVDDYADLDSELKDCSDIALIYDSDVDRTTEKL